MRVVYKKNIYQQMDEEIERAKRIGHEIQKFVVTKEEMEQMCLYVDVMCVYVDVNRYYGGFSYVSGTVDDDGVVIKSYKDIPVEVM